MEMDSGQGILHQKFLPHSVHRNFFPNQNHSHLEGQNRTQAPFCFCMDFIAQKILTANNLLMRGWTDDTDCRLYRNDPETPVHLCEDCPFTKEVWEIIKQWFQLAVIDSVSTSRSLHVYWWKCMRKFDKRELTNVDEIFIYFWWNIRKERNRRQFQHKALNPRQVAILCKDDIMQYMMAMAPRTEAAEV
jgi:hypothetical protein